MIENSPRLSDLARAIARTEFQNETGSASDHVGGVSETIFDHVEHGLLDEASHDLGRVLSFAIDELFKSS